MGDNCLEVATTNKMTDFPLKMKPVDVEQIGTKKLMQARLPFKPLLQKAVKPAAANPKKRKLSEPDLGSGKFPKIRKSPTDNKSKFNTSHDNSDMEVCDEVISSSESGNTTVSSQRTVKSHTLDKFFSPRNVQDEIISSSTSDYVDLTKSDGEEENQAEDKTEEASEKEKENKLSDVFNEDANFSCTIENKGKTNCGSKPALGNKVLKDLTSSPQNKLMAEVRVVLQDVALCDIPGYSTPKSIKKYLNDSTKSSKSLDLSSPIKGKEDTSSGLDNSLLCLTPDAKVDETLSTSFSSHSEVDASTQSPRISEPSGTPKAVCLKTKISSAKKSQRDAMRQKVKEEREKERLQRKEEKEAERLEKLEQRKKEKEKKDQDRQQLKIQKEKERLEKKELLEKERLEKEKIKEDQRRKKQEIIEAKQEEKRKREEEKKQKEEEKMKEEEERLRKQEKTKAAFQNFFFQKPREQTTSKPKEHSGLFMPFEVKNNMRMAPSCRRSTTKDMTDGLDTLMNLQKHETLFLEELKTRGFRPRKSFKTWPKEDEPEDVYYISHEEDVVKKVTYRVKLLQFHTNYRPPYYGTWRKKSSVLTPRHPWKLDSKLFDYEIDSDDEWEEEEPGESLSCSEGEEDKEEKEEEKEEEEDEEDGWMVPHGYLSEGEGCDDDEEITPEMLKARQAAKAESWERQRKQQCLPHKAEHIGCIWEDTQTDAIIFTKLSDFKVCIIEGEFPIATSYNGVPKELEQPETRSASHLKKRAVPEEAMPDLIKFVHGNRAGIKKLVIEFQMFWNSKSSDATNKVSSQGENCKAEPNVETTPGGTSAEKTNPSKQMSTPNTSINESDAPEENFIISKRQIDKKILAIAVRAKRPDFPKICWYVHQEVLKQYGLENLPLRETVSEAKTAEENIASTPNQANTSEAKTPTGSKVCEKPNKTPLRDQMSILSFAQSADKINTGKSDGDCEIVEVKLLDTKSPASKSLPRDQMSILSFTRAATTNSTDKDLMIVDEQSEVDGKKLKDDGIKAESTSNATEHEGPRSSSPLDESAGNKMDIEEAVVDETGQKTENDALPVINNTIEADVEMITPSDQPKSPEKKNDASMDLTECSNGEVSSVANDHGDNNNNDDGDNNNNNDDDDGDNNNNNTASLKENSCLDTKAILETVTAEDKTICETSKP